MLRNSITTYLILIITGLLFSCSDNKESVQNTDEVKIAGAMKEVMHSGKLAGIIAVDTLEPEGLQGIGPESYLTGELLIMDGVSYVSRITNDSQLQVIQTDNVSAPFFVYSHVTEWDTLDLPDSVRNIQNLENYLTQIKSDRQTPFTFRLAGTVESAVIHCQNLPPGTEVHSPKEAHQGQVNFDLGPQKVEVLGFYSKNHQGIFTHHDSYMHMHLLTSDRRMMGHLDEVQWGNHVKLMISKMK